MSNSQWPRSDKPLSYILSLLSLVSLAAGGVYKVEALFHENAEAFERRILEERALNKERFAPATSMATIVERLNSIDRRLAGLEKGK